VARHSTPEHTTTRWSKLPLGAASSAVAAGVNPYFFAGR
jgi:hypothetical protein